MSKYRRIYERRELPSRAKLVYKYLQDRADKDGKCWPAIKTIAKDTSLSVSTVKRGLKDLVEGGYVRKERRVRDNKGDTSNVYYLE